MPATSAARSRGPSAPSLSASARSAGRSGTEGWPLITVWVSSKSRACPAAPLTSAALSRPVDGPRVDGPLHCHPPQQSEEHGGPGSGIDIGSNPPLLDAPADAAAGRRADGLVQLGKDAAQLGYRSQRLAHEDVEGTQ